MISVLILTKDEEQDLPACLASVAWCDDIHVLDSFSQDQTVDIAQRAGACVTQRIFDNYAAQRNAALLQIPFKHSWILILDADEQIPAFMKAVLEKAVLAAPDDVAAFRLRRRDFMGRTWLKHAQVSPYYIRLLRQGHGSYHREINEVLQIDGTVQELEGYFDHFPFSKGMQHWLARHNQYSLMEAQRWIAENQGIIKFSLVKALLSKDFHERRFHQKGLFYKLPARPLLKWLYIMFWRRGMLDGSAGFTYATLQAIYEYFIVLKSQELLNRQPHRQIKPLDALPDAGILLTSA
ncbi:Glycosyltransferase involved in cell wall bisynthesis [Hymenobacter gelipurpurascens]|uniref:Glycosyltransferase involved in cell wall bisynthesis n=1 Tax=Hymenobacter gelipurpurascens TaxID=89968 RepID=A0A212UHI0_9BACT|nr:glycosyltransferase family 2 protein [Hymenobacter gelipurpurascens]SNC77534.1 Glycosyltransferase involved in cell wall bisynthesis [Hymenobacter gelipurpurascens]